MDTQPLHSNSQSATERKERREGEEGKSKGEGKKGGKKGGKIRKRKEEKEGHTQPSTTLLKIRRFGA